MWRLYNRQILTATFDHWRAYQQQLMRLSATHLYRRNFWGDHHSHWHPVWLQLSCIFKCSCLHGGCFVIKSVFCFDQETQLGFNVCWNDWQTVLTWLVGHPNQIKEKSGARLATIKISSCTLRNACARQFIILGSTSSGTFGSARDPGAFRLLSPIRLPQWTSDQRHSSYARREL